MKTLADLNDEMNKCSAVFYSLDTTSLGMMNSFFQLKISFVSNLNVFIVIARYCHALIKLSKGMNFIIKLYTLLLVC